MSLQYLPIMAANRGAGPRRVVESAGKAWAPLVVPLHSARIALISSAAVRCSDQPAFSPPEDTSYRRIPSQTAASDLRIDHRSPIGSDARKDPEIILPRAALVSLSQKGLIGSVAPFCFSFVGGTQLHRQVEQELTPALASELRDVAADAVVFVPY